MNSYRNLVAISLALAVLIPTFLTSTLAGTPRQVSPSEVLLVYNVDSPISVAIAHEYEESRHVENTLAIHCPDGALNSDDEIARPVLLARLWRAGDSRAKSS